MKKERRIISPIKEFFKNTFGVILENEPNDEDLAKEVEVIKSTSLEEGKDYIVKNKKTDKKENNSGITGIRRDLKIKTKTVEIKEKYRNKNYDREIGE